MTDGEKEADRDRPLPILHQLAGDVIDGRDVIGVNGVAETEAVDEERDAKRRRAIVKGEERPNPGADIQQGEHAVDGYKARPEIRRAIVEESFHIIEHGGSLRLTSFVIAEGWP